jgi:hypothetical protein
MGADGRMYSLGAQLVRPAGDTVSVLLRKADLARGTPAPNRLRGVEVEYNRPFARGELRLGLGYNDFDLEPAEGADLTGFIEWRQRF